MKIKLVDYNRTSIRELCQASAHTLQCIASLRFRVLPRDGLPEFAIYSARRMRVIFPWLVVDLLYHHKHSGGAWYAYHHDMAYYPRGSVSADVSAVRGAVNLGAVNCGARLRPSIRVRGAVPTRRRPRRTRASSGHSRAAGRRRVCARVFPGAVGGQCIRGDAANGGHRPSAPASGRRQAIPVGQLRIWRRPGSACGFYYPPAPDAAARSRRRRPRIRRVCVSNSAARAAARPGRKAHQAPGSLGGYQAQASAAQNAIPELLRGTPVRREQAEGGDRTRHRGRSSACCGEGTAWSDAFCRHTWGSGTSRRARPAGIAGADWRAGPARSDGHSR